MVQNNGVGTVLGTLLFAVLGFFVLFPVLAGALASFRPGIELLRRGLSINLDFSTMTLNNWKLLFTPNPDSRKYFMWFKNSMILTLVTVVLTLVICYFVAFSLFSKILHIIDLAVGYATWTALGAIACAVLGVVLFDQHLTITGWVSIIIMAIGVFLLNLFGTPKEENEEKMEETEGWQ